MIRMLRLRCPTTSNSLLAAYLANRHTEDRFYLLLCPTGQHFEIREEGDWWAAVPDDEWPDEASGQRAVILSDFAPGSGDRRQEIVFIGASMDEVRH